MSFVFSEEKKYIVISHPSRKDYYLLKKKENPFLDLSVLTLSEMRSLFDYNYDNRALKYLLKKGFNYGKAKDMLSAFSSDLFANAVEAKEYEPLRDELIKDELLFKTPHPEKTFENGVVLISGYYGEVSLIKTYLDKTGLDIEFLYEEESDEEKVPVALGIFKDSYEELHYVFNEIAIDLDKGTPIDDIYLYGPSTEYVSLLHEYSKMYGFTVDLDFRLRLFDTKAYRSFINAFSSNDLDSSIKMMREENDDKDADKVEKLVREFVDVFPSSKERTIALFNDIAKTLMPYEEKKNKVIKVLREAVSPLHGHVYCINFSMGVYPTVVTEQGFFSDEEKARLGIPTSRDRSLWDNARLERFLKNKNISLITYSDEIFGTQKFISGFVNKLGIKVSENPVSKDEEGNPVEYSHEKGLFLASSMQDLYVRYRQEDPRRLPYSSISDLDDSYSKYDFRYNGTKAFKTSRTYSYSALDSYCSCPFKYLLNNVIRIDDSDSSFSSHIGTIFHKVLELRHTDSSFDFDKAYEEAVKEEEQNEGIAFTPKEKAILDNLKPYCKSSLDFQNKFEKNLKSPLYHPEKSFFYRSPKGFAITGRYDKVIEFDNGEKKSCFIIDYKTGPKEFKEELFGKFGTSMQLPFYTFAAKNDSDLEKDMEIAGIFISPTCSFSLENKEGKEIKSVDEEALKMNGLFSNDRNLLSLIEGGLEGSSKVIKGLGLKKEGEWTAASAKHLKDQAGFDELASKTENFVSDFDKRISTGDFNIAPLVVIKHYDGCEYCPFHDVCYVDRGSIKKQKLHDDDVETEEEEE